MRRRALLGTLLATPIIHPSGAQDFPRQPVRLLVPFAPGGSTDVVARIVAPAMAELLGKPVLVENRPGGGGTIGAEAVVSSPADGHVLGFYTLSAAVLNAGLYRNLRYDTRRDHAPVSLVATLPMVLAAGRHVPAEDLRGLLALMRAHPGRITFGSAGNGTINQLAALLLFQRAGVEGTHVPYRGAGPAITDMIAGNVDVLIEGIPSLLPHVRGGQLRGLAVTSPARNPELPQVGTVAEQGLPGFEVANMMALFAPAATPPAVIARLEAAVQAAVARPEVQRRLLETGSTPVGSTAARLGQYWDEQLALWLPLVRASGATVD